MNDRDRPDPEREDRLFAMPAVSWKLKTALELEQACSMFENLNLAARSQYEHLLPYSQAPGMLLKAVHAAQLAGHEYSLKRAYQTSRQLRPGIEQTTLDRQIHQHARLIDNLNFERPRSIHGPIDFKPLYRLMTADVYAENPGYRKTIEQGPDMLLPPPDPVDIPDLLGAQQAVLTSANLVHPFVRMGMIFARLAWIQPFGEANTQFNLLVLDYLITMETLLQAPMINFADWLLKNPERYASTLQGFHHEEEITDWLIFFFEGLAETSEAARTIMGPYRTTIFELQELTNPLTKAHKINQEMLAYYMLAHPCTTREELLADPLLLLGNAEIDQLIDQGVIEPVHQADEQPLYECKLAMGFWEMLESGLVLR